jgi:hypothetical protein
MKRPVLWAFLAVLILSGCGDDNHPTTIQTSTVTPRTVVATIVPVSFMLASAPTWTPTYTPLPTDIPPTPLPTRTPTVTPTPDPEQVCEAFSVFSAPRNGLRLEADERVGYTWQNAPRDAIVVVTLMNQRTGNGILLQWAPNSINMVVEMEYLTDPGVYEWDLSLYFEGMGTLCPHKGWFILNSLTLEDEAAKSIERNR